MKFRAYVYINFTGTILFFRRGMAVMGMVILSHHVEKTFIAFLKGAYVFIALTVIAIVLNAIHNTFIAEGTFNMFFINRLYQSGIPVLSLFQPLVPNSIYILIFIVGFSIIGYLMLVFNKVLSAKNIVFIVNKVKKTAKA